MDRNTPTQPAMHHPVQQDTEPGELIHRLHPAWLDFIRFCQRLQHGEIEQLKIQDGLPLLAETVRQKVKFTR